MCPHMDIHPHHQAHLLAVTAATALATTVAFHFLLAPVGHGFGFVLFSVVLIGSLLVLGVMTEKRLNLWALLFLIPVVLSLGAETLYASDVVFMLGFLITFVSLTFFGYWFTVPRLRFDEVQSLWPAQILPEVVLPIRGLSELMSGRAAKWRWAQVGVGVLLAIPVLLVIGSLFAGADPLFRHSISGLFDNREMSRLVMELIRDCVVLLFLLGAGWLMLTRAIEGRRPKAGSAELPHLDRTIEMTFLGLVNALFVVFLVFQAVGLFGGEAVMRDLGITYAVYARQGFFQLLAVAGIVFCLTWFLYKMTELRDWGTRGLSLLLIAQTFVVIASAVNRLLLYIDAYGLSVARYWALVTIGIIAAVLLACFIGALAKVRYHELAKYAFPGVLIVVSGLLLFNVEGIVVRFNAQRFLKGETTLLDMDYMARLSTDAVPAMVALARAQWPQTVDLGKSVSYDCLDPKTDALIWERITPTKKDVLLARLSCPTLLYRGPRSDWRSMSLSDFLAHVAVASVPEK